MKKNSVKEFYKYSEAQVIADLFRLALIGTVAAGIIVYAA
jgi:hypothetical protein